MTPHGDSATVNTMPNPAPITKFDIVRELLDIANAIHPGDARDRIHALRDRVIATSPEQLESHPGTTTAPAPADGAEYAQHEQPPALSSGPRAGAQPGGGVQPAASGDPARGLRLLQQVRNAGLNAAHDCRELVRALLDGDWSRAGSTARDLSMVGSRIADNASELAALTAAVEAAEDEIPF